MAFPKQPMEFNMTIFAKGYAVIYIIAKADIILPIVYMMCI